MSPAAQRTWLQWTGGRDPTSKCAVGTRAACGGQGVPGFGRSHRTCWGPPGPDTLWPPRFRKGLKSCRGSENKATMPLSFDPLTEPY